MVLKPTLGLKAAVIAGLGIAVFWSAAAMAGEFPSGRATNWDSLRDRTAVFGVCSGGELDVALTMQTVTTGITQTCTGIETATVGPTAVLQSGSDITILSPSITVEEVDVQDGATLVLGNITIVPIRKTGQTDCWDLAGDPESCGGKGQDGSLQKGVAWPHPRFTNNMNGTVTDNLTDLVWIQAPECGTLFDFPDTTWSAAMVAANAMANGQCGLTDGSMVGDWGLPNAREFESLFHFGLDGLAIPDTSGSGQWSEGDPFSGLHDTLQGAPNTYWGSTSYSDRADLVWCSGLHIGFSYFCPNNDGSFEYVWMVRGDPNGTTPAPIVATGQANSVHSGDDGEKQRGIPWPEPRFTDNMNGTIIDNLTGLVWLKDADCIFTNWPGALTEANTLKDEFPGFFDCGLSDGSVEGEWRLPNFLELRSLIHHAYDTPALPNIAGTGQWADGDPFVDVTQGGYWSSTTAMEDTSTAWNLSFKYGDYVKYLKSTNLYALPVRDPK